MTRKPNVLIVGAQKSGTTWLHSCLAKSRHVSGSHPKELNVFNKDNIDQLLKETAGAYEDKPEASFYLESTPHYFRLPTPRLDIPANILGHLGQVPMIVMFRNPVYRYESARIHNMIMGRLDYEPVFEDLEESNLLLSLGYYGAILEHWREVFPDLKVTFYDDLEAAPLDFVADTFRYLGLSCDLTAEDISFRANAKTNRIEKLGWEAMPKMGEGLRDRLREIYAGDIAKLSGLTGRNLDHWLVQ